MGTVAVYDFGGGTFDFSVLTVKSGVFEVKATGGDGRLGGADLDAALIDFLLKDFEAKEKIDLSDNALAVQRIREQAERTKVELAHSLKTTIYVPFITADAKGPKHLEFKMSRSQHDNLMMPLLQRTLPICDAVLKDAGITKDKLDAVVLAGGSTKWPRLHQLIEEHFGRAPEKEINADEVVAAGAAIQAGVLRGTVSDVLLLDITPITLGLETEGGVMTPLVPRHSTLPVKVSRVFTTVADGQETVRVRVIQGERPLSKDNALLSVVELSEIAPAPRGVPEIEVTFEIDVSGVLSISARDHATGKEQSAVASATGLGAEEMNKMLADTSLYASDDAALMELVSTRNRVREKYSKVEGAMREFRHALKPRTCERVRGCLDATDAVLAGEDALAMRGALKELSFCLVLIAEDVYGKYDIRKAPGTGQSVLSKIKDAVFPETVPPAASLKMPEPVVVAAAAPAAAAPAAAAGESK